MNFPMEATRPEISCIFQRDNGREPTSLLSLVDIFQERSSAKGFEKISRKTGEKTGGV
jgi:hypothetical protein